MINKAKEKLKEEAQKILTQAQEAIQNEKRRGGKRVKEQVGSIALILRKKFSKMNWKVKINKCS